MFVLELTFVGLGLGLAFELERDPRVPSVRKHCRTGKLTPSNALQNLGCSGEPLNAELLFTLIRPMQRPDGSGLAFRPPTSLFNATEARDGARDRARRPRTPPKMPVAPVACEVILEPGIGQFREFTSLRVHTRINSLGLFLVHKSTCGKRESVSLQ